MNRRIYTGTPAASCGAAALLAVAGLFGAVTGFGGEIEDFAWLQATDIHYPHADSREFLDGFQDLGAMPLPGGGTSAVPAFVLATGDLFEFSGGGEWWEEFRSRIDAAPMPVYLAAGNHDNTWKCIWPRIRARRGAPWYSFDRGGVHFVGLSSATPQDPRPSFGEEEVRWLADDLKAVAAETPVVVFFHHPIGGSEYASGWEQDRVLDLLRPFRRVLFITGHYHKARIINYEGFQCVVGGQGYEDRAGFNVFDVRDGRLTIAYRRLADPDHPKLLTEIDLREPDGAETLAARCRVTGDTAGRLQVVGRVPAVAAAAPVFASIDGGDPAELDRGDDGSFSGLLDIDALDPGDHRLTLSATVDGGPHAERSIVFTVDAPSGIPVAWRRQLPTAVKAPATAFAGRIAVAGLDGTVRFLDPASGAVVASIKCAGEILARPLVTRAGLVLADGGGVVRCVGADGRTLWEHSLGDPVYASPVTDGRLVFVVTAEGEAVALGVGDGEPAWRADVAGYAAESPLVYADGTVYFGAWDKNVYAVDAATGAVRWASMGEGSATKPAARYYSPADAAPAIAGGSLFVADRAMILARFDCATGERTANWEKCSAVAATESGDAVYLRRTDGRLTRMTPGGDVAWETADAGMSAVPTAPVEHRGTVYAVSGAGVVRAIDAAGGAIRWAYRSTPGAFVFASPAVAGDRVIVAAMDGRVTAFNAAP